ncbi:MAG: Hpt domain-containing protein [Lachnospiraceae bacterium]|nr:Hpt domain-containing protein [Lachnospiraceae bacterium]
MTVEQVYKNMDSDYASVKDRLQNDALIEKFLIKFLADESYANILKNLEAQNLEETFRAAHTLKGVCQNLGLDRLYKSSYDVTEALRNGKNDVTSEMMEKLESDYDITVSSIRELQ